MAFASVVDPQHALGPVDPIHRAALFLFGGMVLEALTQCSEAEAGLDQSSQLVEALAARGVSTKGPA